MNFLILILCVLSTVIVSSEGQATNNACSIPNYWSGTCVHIRFCNELYRLVQKQVLSQRDLNLLRASQCGNEANMVCCSDASSSTTSRATTTSRPTTTYRPTRTARLITRTRITTTSRPTTTTKTPESRRGIDSPTSIPNMGSPTRIPRMGSPSRPRLSIRKCNEYKEFAYNTFYTYDVHKAEVVPTKRSNCAANTVPTVINGTEALPREFPHMALVGYQNGNKIEWKCGGSLISERFVLSAAHCSETREFGPAVYIRLGEHDLSQKRDAAPIDFNIIERIVHREYRAPIHYHDIVLFKLNKVVQFNQAIRPACLPEQSVDLSKIAVATGWGITAYGNRDLSDVLMKVELEIFSHNECNNNVWLRSNSTLPDGIRDDIQVCAGSHSTQKDTCSGDSGGPLQRLHEIHHCTYTIIGITSFGAACGTIGTPGVYTRVDGYLSWIEGIVWPNE